MTQSSNASASAAPRATAWLSKGVESLAARLAAEGARAHLDFDVLVIGSGYGGAMAAATLAGAARNGKVEGKVEGEGKSDGKVTLCVLERGKEYLPGSFPSRMADLAGHTRFSSSGPGPAQGKREGLFDVRIGPDVNALVANGLGGGSLINAGVMVRPAEAQLARLPLPKGALDPFYDRAAELLGARADGADNTIASRQDGKEPLKYQALRRLSETLGTQARFAAAPLTIAMNDKTTSAGIGLDACTLCGDCATGCNLNAKESLDCNLLVKAQRQGAELFTGATVLRVTYEAADTEARPALPERWCAHVVFTDAELRARQPHPLKIYAGKLILAAGTFGSTEILLRSRSETLAFSDRLGQQFSSNGDMITLLYNQPFAVNAVADEATAPAGREIGPTITGMIATDGMLIEELAVPGGLRRLFEEIATTSHTLHTLGVADGSAHSGDGSLPDPCAVDPQAIRNTTVLALMGDDGAGGALELTAAREEDGDGALRVRWPALRHHALFGKQLDLLSRQGPAQRGGATVLPNPMWKLLPPDLAYLLSDKLGPLLTVHPLGGCPMGADIGTGVVNEYGQVYLAKPLGADRSGLAAGLVVLDGSVIAGALGVNPALTIAALALRAAEALRAAWGWAGCETPASTPPAQRRPVFRILPIPVQAAPTMVEFVERMSGPVLLDTGQGGKRDCYVELTMPYEAAALAALVLPRHGQPVQLARELTLRAAARLHVYDALAWRRWKQEKDQSVRERPDALLEAELQGTLRFFQREASGRRQRVVRAIVPWLLNRGLRDTWQWADQRRREGGFFSKGKDKEKGKSEVKGESKSEGKGEDKGTPGLLADIRRRWHTALALASRAGEVRLFEYDLQVGAIIAAHPDWVGLKVGRQAIHGLKRITYARASNPWNQLTRLTLDRFPLMASGSPRLLTLDTGFLVNRNVALMRILTQQDQPNALADVAAMGMYLLRVLLSVHLWSFRKPDPATPRSAQRLPGALPGLPDPQIRELEVDRLPNGVPVFARLTRYVRADMPATLAPVLLIHGYSASGTSFAHPAVKPSLASHLWQQGHDVWILDMRTSSAMPLARHPWTFEDAAHADIPAAVDLIVRTTGRDKIDVVAHCMGAAMFGMAVLGRPQAGARFFTERANLPKRIGRLVLSQVGPLVVFSQANIFRAYLMAYLNRVIPLAGYTFRVEGEPTLADELLDRLLATLPYPDAEFHIENPILPWRTTPFTGTRHRMDALYGRDFSLTNIAPEVLDNIDDFFGPMNAETLTQAIHLASQRSIANRAGRNVYVSRANLKDRWTFPTLSVHGEDNGLADIATLGRMQAVFADARVDGSLQVQGFPGFGHQDCLIGRDAIKVHRVVAQFLAGQRPPDRPDPAAATVDDADPRRLLARIPHGGPVRSSFSSLRDDHRARAEVGCATSPVLLGALLVAFIPVLETGGRLHIVGSGPQVPGVHPLRRSMELYAAIGDHNGWITLAHPLAPPHADGTLMLIVYDASGLMEPIRFTRETLLDNPLLQGIELMQLLDHPTPPGVDTDTPLARLLEEVAELLGDMADHVYAAIDQELESRSAPQLSLGLIPANPHDVDADGRREEPARETICFALASCQYPAGLLDQYPAFASYRRLGALLDHPVPGTATPEFLVLMGDQIYADATAGLFDPTDLDDRYVRPYEKLLSNPDVQSVLSRLPSFMMLDDHEISDNWERAADPQARSAALEQARRSYLAYQRNDMPPGAKRLWSTFEVNDIAFFMADTRSGRQARTPATAAQAHIMDDDQWCALRDWLQLQQRSAPQRPKFIVTPSMLAPRRLGGHHGDDLASSIRCDAWHGYPASLQRLLALIAQLRLQNVVFLSGDEHLSVDARITLRADGVDTVIRSIHSSALYAPYPFANASAADFEDDGHSFSFSDPADAARQIHCSVDSRYFPGDGFAVVSVSHDSASGWRVDCGFNRAPGAAETPAPDLG